MAHFSEFVYILPANIYFESCRLILSLTYILAVFVDFNARLGWTREEFILI